MIEPPAARVPPALPTPRDQVVAYIGLGANLGDTQATIRAAPDALSRLAHTEVLAVSPLYRSAPIDSTGPDYTNAVAAVRTCLGPIELLTALQDIEQDHGRERPYHNAPRTLDLDLLMYGEQVITTPLLCIPHPRMHARAFVLRPLADLAPNLTIPGRGRLQPLLAVLDDQDVQRIDP